MYPSSPNKEIADIYTIESSVSGVPQRLVGEERSIWQTVFTYAIIINKYELFIVLYNVSQTSVENTLIRYVFQLTHKIPVTINHMEEKDTGAWTSKDNK